MAVAAKYVADKCEFTRLVGSKPHRLDCSQRDIGPHLKGRELESVVPVPAHELQDHRHALLDRDFTGREIESRGGNPDDLFVVWHLPRRRSNYGLLLQITD